MQNSAFAKRFYLDRHHKMERFGVLFVVFFVALVSIFVISARQKYEDDKFKISEQSMYTTEAKWSLTEQTVKVKGIYRNKDTTKVFIALQMSDMTAFSTNPNDFKVFILSDESTGKINHDITGSCYIFGTTGYMGILFNDTKGFEHGVSHIVMRNEARISTKTGVYLEFDEAKDSFLNFNQIEILANLGGQESIVAESLETTDIDVSDIYAECVVPDVAQTYKDGFAATLSDINAKTSVMFENKRRLESYGFTVPFPSCLNGDVITTDAEATINNPVEFNSNMVAGNVDDVIKTVYNNYDSDGNTSVQRYTVGDNLYMVTNFVFPGGCQFNYQNIKPTERYVDVIVPDGMSYLEWREAKEAEISEYSSTVWFDANTKWILDGIEYIPSSTPESLRQTYEKAITDYIASVNEVIAAKYDYQVKQLYTYLDFENSIDLITRVTDINSSEEFVYVSK